MLRALAMLSVAVAALTSCGGSPPEAQPSESSSPTDEVISVPLTTAADPLRDAAASMNTITYVSRSGVNDGGTHVSASVFVPKGEAPADGFPIVAVGHQTTGVTADCAPSLSATLLDLAPTVEALLKAGYVVTVPDYQGMGEPAVTDDDYNHYYPYLDSTTAGYNVIDAVYATRAIVPQSSTSWLALGTREGGQAAWAANELADNYGDDLTLVGTASISPIAAVDGLADAAHNGTLTDEQKVVYARYLQALSREYQYDVDLDDFRRGTAEQQWDALMGCGSSPNQQTGLAAQIAPADLRPADADTLSALRGYLQKTTLPQGPAKAPMLVIYSAADPVSPGAWTDQALDAACAMGDTVTVEQQPQPDLARGVALDLRPIQIGACAQ